jgi:hypothetical protein
MKFTLHQKRSLVVALELERRLKRYRLRYWDWANIGDVVNGTYRGSIRRATVAVLHEAGFVSRQGDDLPREVREQLLCNDHWHFWRLTIYGVEEAKRHHYSPSERDQKILADCVHFLRLRRQWSIGDDDDDDDEGDNREPQPVGPQSTSEAD